VFKKITGMKKYICIISIVIGVASLVFLSCEEEPIVHDGISEEEVFSGRGGISGLSLIQKFDSLKPIREFVELNVAHPHTSVGYSYGLSGWLDMSNFLVRVNNHNVDDCDNLGRPEQFSCRADHSITVNLNNYFGTDSISEIEIYERSLYGNAPIDTLLSNSSESNEVKLNCPAPIRITSPEHAGINYRTIEIGYNFTLKWNADPNNINGHVGIYIRFNPDDALNSGIPSGYDHHYYYAIAKDDGQFTWQLDPSEIPSGSRITVGIIRGDIGQISTSYASMDYLTAYCLAENVARYIVVGGIQ